MKYICTLIVGTIIFFVSSCSEKRSSKDISHPEQLFQNEVELDAFELELNPKILRAFSMSIYDSFLIVNDPSEDYHFKLYNLHTGLQESVFAKIGDGPCEFQFPTMEQIIPSKSKGIGLFNRKNFKYSTFSIGSLMKNRLPICEEKTDNFKIDFQNVIQLNDTLFVGSGIFKKMYATAKSDGDTLQTYINYPFENELKSSYPILAMAYQGNILPHPSGNAFIWASKSSANFDIVNLGENGKLVIKKSWRFWSPVFEGSDGNMISARMKKENVNGFSSVSVTDKFIYLLFSGKNNTEQNPMSSSSVLVFNWSGQPVVKYKLQYEVDLISIDEKDQNLYAYVDDGEAHILKFSLLSQ